MQEERWGDGGHGGRGKGERAGPEKSSLSHTHTPKGKGSHRLLGGCEQTALSGWGATGKGLHTPRRSLSSSQQGQL